jgi:hypothetical protein
MLWSHDSAGPIYHGRYYRTGTEPARNELNFLECWHQVPHLAEGTPLPGRFRAAYCRLGTKPARSEVDFLGCWHSGSKRPVLSQNQLEKVGGVAPNLFNLVLRQKGAV